MFFADAWNLERLIQPWLHFDVLTTVTIEMGQGTLIDYRLRLRGIPVRWQSEIAVWNLPYHFVDEQQRGPYRTWIHEHTFEECNGGMLVRDRVQYAVFGGALINQLFVARESQRIFGYR